MLPPDKVAFEPYKIKMVEPILAADPLHPAAQKRREEILTKAHYNLFKVPAKEVTIDLLTDSGTGAMSQGQWSALMFGDESYAQAVSFEHFEVGVSDVIGEGFHIIPTHQGRAAENILFQVMNSLAAANTAVTGRRLKRRVLINSFFDTTAANVMLHGHLTEEDFAQAEELLGSKEADLVRRKGHERFASELKKAALILQNQLVVDQTKPDLFEHGIFGGNIQLDKLEQILRDPRQRSEVMLVMITATNNTGGGLPVSLANMREIRRLVDHYSANDPVWAEGLPPLMFFMDACRFAENAYFIQQYEPGQQDRPVAEIAKEMFSLVDGCTMSAKKDGLCNIGGFLATRYKSLRTSAWEYMVEIEGFYTYGGLAGRDLETIAMGMKEGVDDRRVRQRIEQVRQLWSWLKENSVPVKEPCGGHGVFLLGRAFWTHHGKPLVKGTDLPGHLLAIQLFRQFGIRACEIGTIMFGDYDPVTQKVTRVAPDEDYVRLAIPRRVYTESHMRFVASALIELYDRRAQTDWRGMRFTHRPEMLPHFLSYFEPIVIKHRKKAE
jgi:tryptophanase